MGQEEHQFNYSDSKDVINVDCSFTCALTTTPQCDVETVGLHLKF
jgi:hypothetical protein